VAGPGAGVKEGREEAAAVTAAEAKASGGSTQGHLVPDEAGQEVGPEKHGRGR